ncbi:hypothetical protein ABZY19_29285 [Streptomyces sp. NPDC006475]|uniref:hypothetical protein n=1 Tax=Streptomyces sp. NPDC006475 TaxID=3155719 RepID=UPI0033A5AE20
MDMSAWRDSRMKAVEASEALRAALAAFGLPESAWSGVRPMVTHSGRALVHLGALPAGAVELIAEALQQDASTPPAGRTEMRWLDTGSGPGVIVPVYVEDGPIIGPGRLPG